MTFEKMINEGNQYYLSRGLAVIHQKKPTPIQIIEVDYPRRSRAKIIGNYFQAASTTDYSGVYKDLKRRTKTEVTNPGQGHRYCFVRFGGGCFNRIKPYRDFSQRRKVVVFVRPSVELQAAHP